MRGSGWKRIAKGGGGLATLAAGAALLAGCGSSATLSHAQLISKADSACSATNAKIASLPAPSSLAALATYASGTRSATTQLHQKLAGLKASSADKAAVDRYLAALEQGNSLLARISSAAAKGDSSAVSSLGTELAAVPTATLASDAGLTDCASAVSD